MYRKSIRTKRYERKRKGALAMVEKRRREMAEEPGEEWTDFAVVLRFSVAPDGRTVALQVGDRWRRTGSMRTLRGLLARAIERKADGIAAACSK